MLLPACQLELNFNTVYIEFSGVKCKTWLYQVILLFATTQVAVGFANKLLLLSSHRNS